MKTKYVEVSISVFRPLFDEAIAREEKARPGIVYQYQKALSDYAHEQERRASHYNNIYGIVSADWQKHKRDHKPFHQLFGRYELLVSAKQWDRLQVAINRALRIDVFGEPVDYTVDQYLPKDWGQEELLVIKLHFATIREPQLADDKVSELRREYGDLLVDFVHLTMEEAQYFGLDTDRYPIILR